LVEWVESEEEEFWESDLEDWFTEEEQEEEEER
jgi:hypothetical protein